MISIWWRHVISKQSKHSKSLKKNKIEPILLYLIIMKILAFMYEGPISNNTEITYFATLLILLINTRKSIKYTYSIYLSDYII